MIMPTIYLANWAAIQARKQTRSLCDNARENSCRIPHEYRVGDQVLVRRSQDNLGKLQLPTEGPYYTIASIENLPINDTVVVDRGDSLETMNIRRLLPYFQPHNRGRECCTPRDVIMTSARVLQCSHCETVLSHILCLCSESRIPNDYSFHSCMFHHYIFDNSDPY
jgi:hypothetical protein